MKIAGILCFIVLTVSFLLSSTANQTLTAKSYIKVSQIPKIAPSTVFDDLVKKKQQEPRISAQALAGYSLRFLYFTKLKML